MMIDELITKIKTAEEKISKIEQTIERHKNIRNKKISSINTILNGYGKSYDELCQIRRWHSVFKEESVYHELYWLAVEIEEKDDAIKNNSKKLSKANEALMKLQEKLRAETVKLQYIQDNVPQVIKDFLDAWKQRVYSYYRAKADSYFEDLASYNAARHRMYFNLLVETVKRLDDEDHDEFVRDYCMNNENVYSRIIDTLNSDYDSSYPYINLVRFYNDKNDIRKNRRFTQLKDDFVATYGDGFFMTWLSKKFDDEWIESQLEDEKRNKMFDLMTRVAKITGEITDASNLSIRNDNLNGYIFGKDGNAFVETIGAGGYNDKIVLDSGRRGQCFHFRTLVKPMK